MTHVPARLRLGLTAAVAAALAVGGTTAAASGAPSSAERDGADLKTRAINALLASAEGSSPAAKAPSVDRATARVAASDGPATGDRASAPRKAPDRAADVGDCTALGLDWTPTHDRVWLHWEDLGLPSYTVHRRRDGGSWQRLGSTTSTRFQDTRTSTHTFSEYRLDASGLSCVMDGWVTMVTPDGRGEVDVLFGASYDGVHPPTLLEQDAYSWAMPSGIGGADPAFSPDGRFVASAFYDAGSYWNIVVKAVGGNRRHVTTLQMPTGFAAAEPAWSPDGRSIAYTRYTVDQAGEVSGSVLHVLDLATGNDREVTGSEGMIQADWRSATTLVAAGFAPGTGLYNVPVAGGTPVAIADTQNAGYPEVAPDGRIWFTEGDGTTFHVRAVVPQANDQVGTVQTSTTHWYERPRVAPDGTVYVVDVDMHDVDNPDDNTFSVIRGTFGPDGMEETAIGARLDEAYTGFHGYDVRQPLSTGTSSFVGDANPDVLARDTSGRQWLYPMTQDLDTGAPTFGSRVLLGTGWQIYTTTVAAGDLTGDGRGDIVARDSSGRLFRYDGKGGGKVAPRVQIGSGWNGYYILSTGDFNGDSRADLMGRDKAGVLWLYPGNGRGGLGAKVKVGSGWQAMTLIVGAGDFDHDNDADVLARDSSGRLWLYPGTGSGGFATKRQVGSGWNVFNTVLGPENIGSLLNLLGRDRYGNLVAYGILGDGRFDSRLVGKIGTGWKPYAITS
jgi:hypothetical protein